MKQQVHSLKILGIAVCAYSMFMGSTLYVMTSNTSNSSHTSTIALEHEILNDQALQDVLEEAYQVEQVFEQSIAPTPTDLQVPDVDLEAWTWSVQDPFETGASDFDDVTALLYEADISMFDELFLEDQSEVVELWGGPVNDFNFEF